MAKVHGISISNRYVSRGDPSADDFTQATLTMDNAFHDLDLSSIVPAGAVMVKVRIYLSDDHANATFSLRKNGNSNNKANSVLTNQVVGVAISDVFEVECDANRVIEYRASEALSTLQIVVLGWWL